MTSVHVIIKLLLIAFLILGLLGYSNFFINVLKINVWLVPAIFISSVTALIYLAGLLNIIPFTEYIIIGGGIVLLLKYRKVFSLSFLRENVIPAVLFLIILGYIAWFDWGGIYCDGDTMNHWALITKSIYIDDRLPNFLNKIHAQSYPPATACWIYFVLKIIGYTEGRALIAQNIAMACFAATMFSFNKKRTVMADVLAFIGIIPCLRLLDALTVDVILGAAVVAGFAVFDTLYSESRKLFLILIPFVITITTIKNSGILFALFISAFAFIVISKYGNRTDAFKYSSLLCGITVGTWYLWQCHIKMVYSAAVETRHSMSAEYTKSVLESRDSAYMLEVVKNFFAKWFSLNESHEWIVIGLMVMLLAVAVFSKKSIKKISYVPICFFIFYLIYKIGLLGMYLINMPGDILEMPAYERYQFTFCIILIGLILWFYCEFVENEINVKCLKVVLGLVISVGCLGIVFQDQKELFTKPDYINGGSHRRLITLINDPSNSLSYGDKILLYHTNKFNYIEDYTQTTMENEECVGTNESLRVAEALVRNRWNYDKLVIFSKDDKLEQTLKEYDIDIDLSESVIELTPYEEEEN